MAGLYQLLIPMIFSCTATLLVLVPLMVLYNKKGEHSWAALIPVYNEVIKFKIAGLSPWLVLLYLVPIANVVIDIISNVKFIKAYGKSTGFAVAALFLPIIFYPMTAFPVESKEKVDKNEKKVNKTVYAVLTLLFGTIGINKFYAGKIKAGILNIIFCWTLVPTILSIAEFITVLTEKADKNGEIPVTSQRRSNVFFGVGVVLFASLAIAVIIPWESLFTKFTYFSDFNKSLNDIKIGKYQIFNSIIGAPVVQDAQSGSSTGVISALGAWSMTDMATFLVVVAGIVALVNNIKLSDFIASSTNKIKKVLPVAITAMLISIVLVVMVTTGINVTIVHSIVKGFNIATITLGTIIGSIFTADFYYFISTIGPVFTTAIKNTDLYGVVGLLIQSIYYLTMFVAPTSVGLVIGLYYLDIPYGKWLKYIWKVLLIIFLIVVLSAIVVYLFVLEKTVAAVVVTILSLIVLIITLVLIRKISKK